jgi:hypothetical protein
VREDISEKTWSDMDSFDTALEAGRALFEARRLATKPPEYTEEPPF